MSPNRCHGDAARRQDHPCLAAGFLIACGIGIGATNPWWAAVVFGAPLIGAGVLLVPAATARSELPRFRRASGPAAVPVRVDAMTRSSLRTGAVQPTLVSALVSPPGDTPFQARWISSMPASDARELVASPFTAIRRPTCPGGRPPLPSSTTTRGRRHCRIDRSGHRACRRVRRPGRCVAGRRPCPCRCPAPMAPAAPSWRGPHGHVYAETSAPGRADPHHRTRRGRQCRGVWFDRGGSDRCRGYDPATGQAVTVHYIKGVGWAEPRREATDKRRRDTFSVQDLMSADIEKMTATMRAEGVKSDAEANLADLDMRRPDKDGDPAGRHGSPAAL